MTAQRSSEQQCKHEYEPFLSSSSIGDLTTQGKNFKAAFCDDPIRE
jgi:hypothetical protein